MRITPAQNDALQMLALGDLDLYELVFKILAGFLSFGSKTA